ncbi:MAG: hypothetical protein MUD01_11500 [Chloroflexaceae bacterium]|nr:hypothetical protein [Chloroflexaceae bacterium]
MLRIISRISFISFAVPSLVTRHSSLVTQPHPQPHFSVYHPALQGIMLVVVHIAA